MAEKFALGGLPPLGSKDLGPTSDEEVLELHHEASSDEESQKQDASPETERKMLQQHQKAMRTARFPHALAENHPSRSYAASAAAATVTEIYVGRSGNMKDKVPMGRHRPRSVCIHARNGQIDARALISKLAEAEAPITHIQRLGNGDMEITFPSIEVRNKFFSLPFVHSPRRRWEAGLTNPPPLGENFSQACGTPARHRPA